MAAGNKLIRAVGRWDLTALAVNGVIGAGIFGLPADVARLTGPWSPLACLLCACIILFIVLCFAEVSSLFESTGGPYLYARESFGEVLGFVAGWMMWVARVTAFGANANLLISYLGYFLPGVREGFSRAVVLVAVAVLLTWVNIRGVRQGALVGDILAGAKLLPMMCFVLVGVLFIDPKLFNTSFQPSYENFGQAIVLYVFAFTGFEFAAIPAGEAVSPKKDLPKAMLSALGIAAVLYAGIQVVCLGTLPELAKSQTAMADASARFLGSLGGQLIALTALVSIAGNLSGMYLVSPRLTYALAEDGVLPSPLAAVHPKYRTPYVSILLYGLLTLSLALTGTFVGLVKISVVVRVVAYVLTCLAVPVLRKRSTGDPDRFQLKGGYTIPIVAVILCVWLFSRSEWRDAKSALYALAVGFALYGAARLWKRRASFH